jgi:hypothetical protein
LLLALQAFFESSKAIVKGFGKRGGLAADTPLI